MVAKQVTNNDLYSDCREVHADAFVCTRTERNEGKTVSSRRASLNRSGSNGFASVDTSIQGCCVPADAMVVVAPWLNPYWPGL